MSCFRVMSTNIVSCASNFGRFYRLQMYVSSERSTDVPEKLPHKHGVKRKLPYNVSSLQLCDAVSLGDYFPTFRTIVVPLASE
jgi:hypothetical protein